jgi:hypothetical protein
MTNVMDRAWVMVVAVLMLPCAVMAQVTVNARVASQRVYVGDAVQLSIEVGGSKAVERPKIPAVAGASVVIPAFGFGAAKMVSSRFEFYGGRSEA